jgi:hypothetical protein
MAHPLWPASIPWLSPLGTAHMRGLPKPEAGAGRGCIPRLQACALLPSSPRLSRGASLRLRAESDATNTQPVCGPCATTPSTSATRPAIRAPASLALPVLASRSHNRPSSTARSPTACAEKTGVPARWWHNTHTGPPRFRSGAPDSPHADRAHQAESHRPRISFAYAPPPASPAGPCAARSVDMGPSTAGNGRPCTGGEGYPGVSPRAGRGVAPYLHAPCIHGADGHTGRHARTRAPEPSWSAAPLCCPYHPPLPLVASNRAKASSVWAAPLWRTWSVLLRGSPRDGRGLLGRVGAWQQATLRHDLRAAQEQGRIDTEDCAHAHEAS